MSARTAITAQIAEESTVGFTVAFLDEDGESVIPDTIIWTLTDGAGTVINSREDVEVSPAASVTIVLSGDDLAITGRDRTRLLLIEWTYTSDLGAGLPAKHEVAFDVVDLVGV